MNVVKSIGFFICVFVVLSIWGCLPDDWGDDSDWEEYQQTDEYRMEEIERKYQMLENNKNW